MRTASRNHLRLGMPNDDVPLALVARRGRLTYSQEAWPRRPDRRAPAATPPHRAPRVPGHDPAHAGRRAGGVPALGWIERAEDDQLSPDPIEVHIVHVPQHRADLGARRSRRDLRHGDRTVRAVKPLHVGQRVPAPRGPAAPQAPPPRCARTEGRSVLGQHHGPLDPGLAEDFERRGLVVGDRREDGLAADRHAVEGVLVADQELLEQPGRLGVRRNRLEPAAQRGQVVEPVRRLRSRAGGRLGDERESDGLGERQRLISVGDQLMPGTGHASSPSTDFIRDLSRTLSAVSTSMPSRPSVHARTPWAPATARGRRPGARHDPICWLKPRTASTICCGSSGSSTRRPAEKLLQVGGSRSTGLAMTPG